MLTKSIAELYDADYNITNIFAMKQYWKEHTLFKMTAPRPTACLLFFCGCDGLYNQNGKHFTVKKNSVIYIPRGSTYDTRFLNCHGCATILIEFNLITPDGILINLSDRITTLAEYTDPLLNRLFDMASELFSSTVVAISKLKSVVYDILAELSAASHQQKIYSPKYSSIAKGIAMLYSGRNLHLSIDEIAKECNVSPATFRRLFKEYSGVSPAQYRTFAQIEYAKKLLCTGTMTVAEIAAATGFGDSAYFCRVFKKKTGRTPSEYCCVI